MLEVYSKSITALANSAIPLNNVALDKGTSTKLQGVSTIEFNKCGVYKVSVSASAVATVAGAITIQLEKNGVVQPQAETSATAADTTTIYPLAFTTLVQVDHNNCNCLCSSPDRISLINAGVGTTYNQIDVVVTRVQL